jgi:hypothetical protein
MSDPFGYWPDASKVWRLVNCIQQVNHEEIGWDPFYCVEIGTICILSLVNFALVVYLTYFDVKTYGKEGFKKIKIWLLITMLVFYTLLVIRYTFSIFLLEKFYQGVKYVCVVLR